MSSPNHLTSNIEDAFSSNFPDFIPASPDYVPASPGKTYSSSSNSFGIVPLASPTLLLFHDDPYMKVFQAFYTEKSPIPPPAIIPPSSSLILKNSFFLKNFCHLRNEVIIQQDFDILEAELQQARAQITKLQRKQMGSNHKISLARFRITKLGDIINDIQIHHQADMENLQDAINELKNN
ncbi:hypothetical protein Tco_0691121 [Tanacetum coccineum]